MITKINKVILIFLFFMLNTNAFSQSYVKLFKSISNYEYHIGIRKVRKDKFFEVKKELDTAGRLNFLNECDTIFMLESSNIENGAFYGKIWCNSGMINYYYLDGIFYFDKTQIFTNYCTKLVQSWDTAQIRHEEMMNPVGFTPSNIMGTRVIKKGDDFEINCILFKEFFLLERDK